jgi:hypothetical protein
MADGPETLDTPKDLQQVFDILSCQAAFHGDASLVGMLLENAVGESLEENGIVGSTAIPINIISKRDIETPVKLSRCGSFPLGVGVYAGKSLLVTAAGFMRSCEVTAVDNFSLGALGAEWLQAVSAATIERIHALTRARITLQVGSSLEIARQLAREGRRFDSVFLDGCHEYAECKADIEIWTMLIRPGGILAGHDYWPNHWGVMEAVQETGPFEVVPDTRIWFRHLPAATP